MGHHGGHHSRAVRAGLWLMAALHRLQRGLLPAALCGLRGLAARDARRVEQRRDWPARTIAYLAVGGAVVMLRPSLVVFTSFDGAPPGSVYKPATIGENGKIIPGHFE